MIIETRHGNRFKENRNSWFDERGTNSFNQVKEQNSKNQKQRYKKKSTRQVTDVEIIDYIRLSGSGAAGIH